MRVLVDVLGFLLVTVNICVGYWWGLLRRAFSFAGLFAAVGLATLIGNGVVRYIHGRATSDALYADQWSFIAVFLGTMAIVELLGVLYDDKITRIASLMFDRSVGVVAGAAVGFFEIAVICVVCFAVGSAQAPDAHLQLPGEHQGVSDAVQSSIIGGGVHRIESGILDVFRPVLPNDLPAHLAENVAPN